MGAGLVSFYHYHCPNSIHILGKTMSREEIRSTVRTYLAEQLYFDFDIESDDSDLFESGNIDSLGFVTFIGFLQATIDLGHNLGLEVVAEGVETASNLFLLQPLGCDAAQGYYFTKPLDAQDFNAWRGQNIATGRMRNEGGQLYMILPQRE